MAKAPWFKLYAADYVTDPVIDKMSLPARGILLSIWSLLWIEGRLPSDPEELARKLRIRDVDMHMHMQEVMQVLKVDAYGNLYSERMDKEMARSENIHILRKKAANTRWNQQDNAHAYAAVDAVVHKQTGMQSESESESESKSVSESKAKATPLPQWLPQDPWKAFVEMRKKIRAPLTPRAITLTLNALEKLRLSGQDPGAVLDQSTVHSWRGIFPLKTNGNGGNGNETPSQRLQRAREQAFSGANDPIN